jgi:aryl-alcohol dehydrogenase-like predicted oxidoreductase
MRMSTDEGADQEEALATIAAAAEAGVTVFDTAHSYGSGARGAGQNERLLVRALRACGADERARIVTKGGMVREGNHWIPDGRARRIRSDCEASLVALDGLPIDLYLIHAPDPRTPWVTTVRALARLVDDGLVRRVGVANINRPQLEEALEITDVAAVQVALSPYDDRAVRGGLVAYSEQRGVTVMAHSPLGGPRRAAGLERRQALAGIAARRGATPAEIALAWLLDISPSVVPIPGARPPETARSAARAAKVRLDADDRVLLADGRRPAPLARRRSVAGAEVVLLMGIPGAGKSRVAEQFVAKGHVRLNRDEVGGSLRQLASILDERLSDGEQRVVLDNTYLTRAARSYVVETATRHGASTRCVWIDTPLAQAQVNLVERLLDRFGSLPTLEETRRLSRREPGLLMPTSQMRALRELEPPSADEGFAAIEVVPFSRLARPGRAGRGVFVAAAALERPGWKAVIRRGATRAPHLVFDWTPGAIPEVLRGKVAALSREVTGVVTSATCPHEGGPPRCWCRPPLPGLPLAFARVHGLDPARSILIGTSPTHRTLATSLDAGYLSV